MFGFFNDINLFKMNLILRSLAILLLLTSTVSAQNIPDSIQTIQGKFDFIYNHKRNNYKIYKVIERVNVLKLKKNVLDTINVHKQTIGTKNKEIKGLNTTIKQLNSTITNTKSDLDNSISKENSISLLGIDVNKNTYNGILWSLIALLALALGFFIYKFSNSNIVTKEAQKELKNIEDELDTYRKKSIEREQKLRRQLQDEINKQK